MPSGKYRIRRIDECGPSFLWALYRPDGMVKVTPTWGAAVRAMDLDAARQVARRNRVPLGPIRKSEGK